MNCYSKEIFLKSPLFITYFEVLIQEYENIAENIVEPLLESKSKECIDLQVKVQKRCQKEISYKNQRTIEEFKETTKNFYFINYHNLAQKMIINYIFENIFENLTDEFVRQFNNVILNLLELDSNKKLIKDCFMTKFHDFEERLKLNNF